MEFNKIMCPFERLILFLHLPNLVKCLPQKKRSNGIVEQIKYSRVGQTISKYERLIQSSLDDLNRKPSIEFHYLFERRFFTDATHTSFDTSVH